LRQFSGIKRLPCDDDIPGFENMGNPCNGYVQSCGLRAHRIPNVSKQTRGDKDFCCHRITDCFEFADSFVVAIPVIEQIVYAEVDMGEFMEKGEYPAVWGIRRIDEINGA
jgi:hypothetical protein